MGIRSMRGPKGVFLVDEVRRRDEHGVEVGHGEQHVAAVRERAGVVSELLQQTLAVAEVVGADVADGAEAYPRGSSARR